MVTDGYNLPWSQGKVYIQMLNQYVTHHKLILYVNYTQKKRKKKNLEVIFHYHVYLCSHNAIGSRINTQVDLI